MTKGRLEAFSDGVIAIIITIMVLELKVPHSAEWSALHELIPIFMSYVLSFVYVAVYWGNHHHLLHTVKNVSAGIIWSNAALLFFLSLIPFATAWMGENHFAQNTVIAYSILMNLCGMSYYVLMYMIMQCHSENAELTAALNTQRRKGILSLFLYSFSIGAAFINPMISQVIFVLVAIMWFIPDKNIKRLMR
ncbi:MAG TPA: TMEM175 family protein [Chitinophagales bacterium]|nr:TMEM175 family protein [Chitinophagales bacterium]HNI54640.1 TMEM175 family protein [Chitinophagales bacterium]HNJ88720.1 TMEM175 family protein [Chitinophagales bacterium]HNK97052.1 TMEM175 family protein [Chitinophagales bacterium]HNM08783.1 TMEM175 family protein [Chitinophagales bacterium]